MVRKWIVPNEHQGATNEPVLVESASEENLPSHLTRMGLPKLRKLIGLVEVRKMRVLELFSGSNFSTAFLLGYKPQHLIASDLHYSLSPWRYVYEQNFVQCCRYLNVKPKEIEFVAGDVRKLDFGDCAFDVVVAADPPRTRLDGVLVDNQEPLFCACAAEAWRVLKWGGVFVTTIPVEWRLPVPFARTSSQTQGNTNFVRAIK